MENQLMQLSRQMQEIWGAWFDMTNGNVMILVGLATWLLLAAFTYTKTWKRIASADMPAIVSVLLACVIAASLTWALSWAIPLVVSWHMVGCFVATTLAFIALCFVVGLINGACGAIHDFLFAGGRGSGSKTDTK